MKKCAIILLLLIIPGIAGAHPYDVFGTGPRAIAMGGAYAALSDDIAGIYYNIAGIANVPKFEAEFGYLYGEPTLMINDKDMGVDRHSGTYFGMIISHMILNHRFSVGANLYIPDDHVLRFQMLPSHNPRYTMYTNRNHSLVALIGIGLELFSWWNIGIGLNILGDNYGGVDFIISETAPSQGSLESSIGSIFSPIAGIWLGPVDFLDIGFSYREKIEVRLDLPNNVSMPELYAFDESGIPILKESYLSLQADSFSHFSPRQFQLGTAWRIHHRLLIALDITHYAWSEFKNPTPSSSIELTGGLGDLFEIAPPEKLPDPKFEDVIVPALGIEGRALDMDQYQIDARFGYFYRQSPVRDLKGYSNFLDSDTHVLSAGIGARITDPLKILLRPYSFDAYFQAHILEPRSANKTLPNDPTGDYEISGYILVGGATLTLRF